MAAFKLQREHRDRNYFGNGLGWRGAAYDSEFIPKDHANAELILTLRIRFVPLDPKDQGNLVLDADKVPFAIRKWVPDELRRFKWIALRQANETWNNQLWLVPPHDFDLLDWPPGNPTVRPNVKCVLNCVEEDGIHQHATVLLACLPHGRYTPLPPRPTRAFRSHALLWNNFDIWPETYQVQQANEDVKGWTVPHEVGHLLGLDHIGRALLLKSCLDILKTNPTSEPPEAYADAADAPKWMANNIMGTGHVVHACNASPWLYCLAHHTGCPGERWLPSGAMIPPRRIADIPKQDVIQNQSPYQGGYQGVGDFRQVK